MSTKTLKPVAGHLLGPFSTPKTYYAPKYKGFMGVPRNNIHVPGWGIWKTPPDIPARLSAPRRGT